MEQKWLPYMPKVTVYKVAFKTETKSTDHNNKTRTERSDCKCDLLFESCKKA